MPDESDEEREARLADIGRGLTDQVGGLAEATDRLTERVGLLVDQRVKQSVEPRIVNVENKVVPKWVVTVLGAVAAVALLGTVATGIVFKITTDRICDTAQDNRSALSGIVHEAYTGDSNGFDLTLLPGYSDSTDPGFRQWVQSLNQAFGSDRTTERDMDGDHIPDRMEEILEQPVC